MKTKQGIFLVAFLILGLLAFDSCKKKDDCTEQTWYRDADGDGFGNPNSTNLACEQPEGYVLNNTDFNDNSASAYPGATEICDDGIDNDGNGFSDCEDLDCINSTIIECNCADGEDNDGDGFTDCDDTDCIGSPDC